MPHPRDRHILPALLKRLKFSPVLALQGARQVGKSFLVREILAKEMKSTAYRSLDRLADRDFARSNPETFLKQFPESGLIMIDEAQKAPDLFDAIKHEVDQDRRPGRFLLLGSTEFSKLTLVRESLTGRMSRIRLFPLNLAETLGLGSLPLNGGGLFSKETPRVSRKQVLDYLERGGMPGLFAVRDSSERESLRSDWLELTASRDLLQFPKLRLDPELASRILARIATLESPDAGSIARALKRDLRRVRTHLSALESLFVINRLPSHPAGTGKPLYFLFDVGMATALGAGFERQLHTWTLQEELSRRACADDRETKLFYYRTPKGRMIHLIEERHGGRLAAIQIFPDESVQSRDFELLRAFKTKTGPRTELFGLGSSHRVEKGPKIEMLPWETFS